MILLDRPYASDYLLRRIREGGLATVETPVAREMGLQDGPHLVSESEAVASLRQAWNEDRLKLYSNSENALGWVAEHLAPTGLPDLMDAFKDKARFRRLTESLTPGYACREVPYDDLSALDTTTLPFPLILKPAVGFFSVGVRYVPSTADWPIVLEMLRCEMEGFRSVYPAQVLDTRSFVIESYVEGREFAIDAYYDARGEPVILNLLEHVFSSDADVGDRVYVTSPDLVRRHLAEFTEFLAQLGEAVGARHIPVHVELRITADGTLFPIEVNPLRFGGFCTTADLTGHAYGIDSIRYYLENRRPDWDAVLAGREGKRYALIVLNNSTGVQVEQIVAFDHEALARRFSKVLELRPIDHRRFRLFGFVFLETDEHTQAELEWILHDDLRDFITRD